jgi:hypothetical protein
MSYIHESSLYEIVKCALNTLYKGVWFGDARDCLVNDVPVDIIEVAAYSGKESLNRQNTLQVAIRR